MTNNTKRLLYAAKNFISTYNSVFGEPEKEFVEYWELRQAIDEIGSVRKKPTNPEPDMRKSFVREKTKRIRIHLVIALMSCWRTHIAFEQSHGLIAVCSYDKDSIHVILSLNRNGSIKNIVFKRNNINLTQSQITHLTKIIRKRSLSNVHNFAESI